MEREREKQENQKKGGREREEVQKKEGEWEKEVDEKKVKERETRSKTERK